MLDALETREKNLSTEEDNEEISKRKENYYGNNGTLEIFNLESKFREGHGKYHNKNKEFCERFNLINKDPSSSLKRIT